MRVIRLQKSVSMLLAAGNFLCACDVADREEVPTTTSDMDAIRVILRRFKEVTGQLPTTEEGLGALVEHKMIVQVPNDPWGRPYQYRRLASSKRGYDLFSQGPELLKSSDDIHTR